MFEEIPELCAEEQQSTCSPWKPSNVLSSMESGANCWVAEGSCQYGYCLEQRLDDIVEILNIVIFARWRGRGLGQAFLSGILQQAREESIKRAWLEVRAGNKVAIRLYERTGFTEQGRREDYYAGTAGAEDALLFELFLDASA